jgi:N-acetylmuramoyl-L-alanine amidase
MRAINKIFIHSSATPEGRHHTAADICGWHRQRGWKQIGYHYVIQLDGTVEEARNKSIAGAHVVGHNTNSIGICYIGGTDAAGKAKDTRTPAQRMALLKLLQDLKEKYPNAEILGHKDAGSTDCPSFDAREEYKCL